MPMPSPHKPSDVEVQIAALRALVHALMSERVTDRDQDHIRRTAHAELASLPYTDEFKARAVAAVNEVIVGERKHP